MPNSNRKDYNHIKCWLDPQLKGMKLSIEKFSRLCNLSRTSIYFYRADITRPDEQSMLKMCQVLGVPFEEGLSQYTPKPNGRPRTSGRGRR